MTQYLWGWVTVVVILTMGIFFIVKSLLHKLYVKKQNDRRANLVISAKTALREEYINGKFYSTMHAEEVAEKWIKYEYTNFFFADINSPIIRIEKLFKTNNNNYFLLEGVAYRLHKNINYHILTMSIEKAKEFMFENNKPNYKGVFGEEVTIA